jgi:uncharacterized protein (TIGR03437 family)
MERSRTIFVAKCAAVLGVIPVLAWAYAAGPLPHNTGAPGDTTCSQSGCHAFTNTSHVNTAGGSVQLAFDSGTTYTPGTKVHVTVTITDATARVYGFEASARIASSNKQAGTFVKPAAGVAQFVQCEDSSDRPAAGCPASAPLEFIQHSSPSSVGKFEFDWTPPTSSSVGNVMFYVAANAANGNGLADPGDHIYTTNATLTLATTTGPKPTISAGGIADAFNNTTGVAPETWISIYGTNLASATKTWDGDPAFTQVPPHLPTSVSGVSVTVNGKTAPVYFVSAGQINILCPTDSATGTVAVIVTNANGASDPFMVMKSNTLPAFYAPFNQNGKLYVTGVNPVSNPAEYWGKVGLDPRVSRPVKPGETIEIFGTGWGPSTNSSITTDMVTFTAAPLVTQPTITIGGQPAQLSGGAGYLVSPGLYQFNVVVPNVPDGDQPIVATLGSVTTANTVVITVKH